MWIVLRGNTELRRGRGWTAEELWFQLGVSSCGDLGRSIAHTLGLTASVETATFDLRATGRIALGDSRLLHSKMRRGLIDRRDLQIQIIDDAEARFHGFTLSSRYLTISRKASMTDILIRNVPDEVLRAIDAKAKRIGLSRTQYLRRALERDCVRSVGPVSVDQLRHLATLSEDLDDPAVMSSAWS